MRFAADRVNGRGWRFYVPASPEEEGAFDAATPRYEGHWRSSLTDDEELPWPEPDDTWADRDSFLESLELVEATADVETYRGYSLCRLCGCRNGTRAFRFVDWEWPEGYRHYLLAHQVRPSVEFEHFVRASARKLSRPGA